jgi:hypothetical protein
MTGAGIVAWQKDKCCRRYLISNANNVNVLIVRPVGRFFDYFIQKRRELLNCVLLNFSKTGRE